MVEKLIAGRATLVGVDFWNVDDTDDPARPVHTALLAADILTVEHLRGLGELPNDGTTFLRCRSRSQAPVPFRPSLGTPLELIESPPATQNAGA